ncbi:MAG: adenylate/guanylate cyclase domain-containing protein [Hyphomicrobiales bacterium]|nr:adenylate/guanylate cyclase domain-containing protein [Hyphomicrobiales bacterium]
MADWLIEQGIQGASQETLLQGYCDRLLLVGIPVQRVHVAQRAFHPQFGSIGFDWLRDKGVERELLAHVETPRERWLKSPLYYLLEQEIAEMRERLPIDGEPHRFPFLDELRERGGRDYFAVKVNFGGPRGTLAVDPNNTPEGMVISWTSDAVEGFSDGDLAVLRQSLPPLGLALKSSSNRQMANDVASIYLGADAGARVLSGEIQRGSFESIHAVVWYFDLQGFTKLSEKISGPENIVMLNDYFGAVVSVVEKHGGNVLKFMGDGLLAIFNYEAKANVVDSAINAAIELRKTIGDLNAQRASKGLPVTDFSLALHGGDVLYGNIGGEARLDFTVIGPAVNTSARILSMGSQLERSLIISSNVAESVSAHKDQLVSLGRYMLRGVAEPQELFTLYQGDS